MVVVVSLSDLIGYGIVAIILLGVIIISIINAFRK